MITLPETCPDWGFTPTEMLPPDKQAARRERIESFKTRMKQKRKERIEAFKKRMAQKRKAREDKLATRIPLPPIYDEVWAEGMRWLDDGPEETP